MIEELQTKLKNAKSIEEEKIKLEKGTTLKVNCGDFPTTITVFQNAILLWPICSLRKKKSVQLAAKLRRLKPLSLSRKANCVQSKLLFTPKEIVCFKFRFQSDWSRLWKLLLAKRPNWRADLPNWKLIS
jgi:hypothetical protein